ncbi:LapA family protein [Thiohalobacter sp. IOR34]|uniref:LapA family protein n=1 Tax=Thiohalobacter sp. IOR34 TaxID=3057176 RepID=UPI0025B0597A|nr:LapA family protein [Thiohalobacter sp. IOR34]WJW76694.1 LapA family protein [Thiohalobacter sp. IOR34]
MARFISFLALLLLVLLGLAFSVLNAHPVQLDYFFGSRQVPLALTLVLTLAVGALLGILFSLGLVIRLKRENLRLRRKAQVAEQEISNLRAIPIKDPH